MFTQNQVRQFYVANSYVGGSTAINAAGQIKLKKSDDNKYFWFEFMDADGHIIRTDIIDVNKLSHITLTEKQRPRMSSFRIMSWRTTRLSQARILS